MTAGRFREDLYYRLAALELRMPALRERPQDLGSLMMHLLDRRAGGGAVTGFDEEAMRLLEAWRWPGNVRELEAVVQRLCLLCAGKVVTADVLRQAGLQSGQAVAAGAGTDLLGAAVEGFERAHLARVLGAQGGATSAAPLARWGSTGPPCSA